MKKRYAVPIVQLLFLAVLIVPFQFMIPIRADAGRLDQSTTPQLSTLELIEQAYEAGTLDYETALVYKVYYVFDPDRLPEEYRSSVPSRGQTGVLKEVRRAWKTLSPECRQALSPYMRDDASGAMTVIPEVVLPPVQWIPYETDHFIVQYTWDAPHAPPNFAYVLEAGAAFETVWSTVVSATWLSYPQPAPGRWQPKPYVYIFDQEDGSYGESNPEWEFSEWYMENDYAESAFDYQPDKIKLLQTTAAHEFFHRVATVYEGPGGHWEPWWEEASCVWMEDLVYDGVNDYLILLGQLKDPPMYNWFDHPEEELNMYEPMHGYGNVVFLKYLSTRYGGGDDLSGVKDNDIVKRVWQRIGAIPYDPWLSHLEATLINENPPISLADAFRDFTIANYKLSPYRNQWYLDMEVRDQYPNIKIRESPSDYPTGGGTMLSQLSSDYVTFLPDTGWPEGGTLQITIQPWKAASSYRVTIVKELVVGGTSEIEEVTLPASGPGVVSIPNFGSNAPSVYKSATMIVSIVNSMADNYDYTYAADYYIWHYAGLDSHTIYDLAAHPTSPETLYAATEAGVYKTTDGGVTWSPSIFGICEVHAVAIDWQTPETVYAGMSQCDDGIYKSTDGGGNWVRSGYGLDYVWVDDLVVDPFAPSTVYAATAGGGLYRTTDGGGLWSPRNQGIELSWGRDLVIDPAHILNFYIAVRSGYGKKEGVYRSTNAGYSWVEYNEGNLDAKIITSLGINENSFLYGGSLDLYSSARVLRRTEMTVWDYFGDLQAADAGSVITGPQPQTLFVPTTDGVYQSIAGANWQEMTGGLDVFDCLVLEWNADQDTLYVGTQAGVYYWGPVSNGLEGVPFNPAPRLPHGPLAPPPLPPTPETKTP